MSILSEIIESEIRDAARELDAKVLTRPALLVTDGASAVYAVDWTARCGAQKCADRPRQQ